MTLHVETQGNGSPLLLIHGWGMHGGMWSRITEHLAKDYTVHCVDLPGHGASAATEAFDLDSLVQQLKAQFPGPLDVCGWSLGGQVALRWAESYPNYINKLVLVATTPCFVQKNNWDCAMEAETLQLFAESLLQNHEQTLRRFLALQVRGSESERELLNDLRARLSAKGEPNVAALHGGLAILRDADFRHQLSRIQHDTLVIAGERDTLTPAKASEFMVKNLANAKLAIVPGASHAPFLSHPEIFLRHMMDFLNE